MRLTKKLLLGLIGAVLLVIVVYQVIIQLRYRSYQGYESYLTDLPGYEQGSTFTPLSTSYTVTGMTAVCENETLALFVNEQTAEIAVLDKRSGAVTYSNPPEADQDPVANALNKALLKSQLVVDFYNVNRTAGQYNTFSDSVREGHFTLESLADGLRCVYTIGITESPTGIVPVYITEQRLLTFTAKLEDREAKYITSRYLASKTVDGFLELSDSARSGQATLRNLGDYLAKAGYTEQDFNDDMLSSGVEGAVPIRFVIPLEYRLDDDGLRVSILTDAIQEFGGGSIVRIQMLRYFGAAGVDESGYLLVPNGSGSIIHFNNGKTSAEEYSQYMYGQDPLASEYITLSQPEIPRLPMFGLSRPSQSIVATIESGDALSMVTAGVSGKFNAYNYAYASFTLRGYSSLAMFGTTGNEANLPVVERNLYSAELTVRYSLLQDSGYSAMAAYLREYWKDRGLLPETAAADSVPLFIDLIGSVTADKYILGFKYKGQLAMTGFDQAAEIVSSLADAGIDHQIVNYQGWQGKGYYQGNPDNTKIVKSLGSRADLSALTAQLEDLGGKLYADAAFQHVSFVNAKGYNDEMETARFYGGSLGFFGQVNPATLHNTAALQYRDTLYDLLSPKFLDRYVSGFLRGMKKYDVTGYSLRDLADALHSDRKRTGFIDRQQAQSIVTAQWQRLAESGQDLLASGGSFYALAYTDELINVPMAHNDFYLVDEEIPFYQMILHGTIHYAGSAINLSDLADAADCVIRHIEYGASPHFTFTYESASEMKYTGANRKYATTFDTWRDTAIEIYEQINQALAPVAGQAIVSHEILPGGLRRVGYENGVVYIINRTAGALDYNGSAIAPMSYIREGAGA